MKRFSIPTFSLITTSSFRGKVRLVDVVHVLRICTTWLALILRLKFKNRFEIETKHWIGAIFLCVSIVF